MFICFFNTENVMCKIAVGVMTHNHPEVVGDVLEKCIQDYYDCGIDIYYFDSSADDLTENIIKEFVQRGYQNLYYVRYPSTPNWEIKMKDILGCRAFEKEYDYIWPIKDRAFCPKETLEEILRATEEKPDAIFLGVMSLPGKENIRSRVYNNEKDFYADWAWLATSWDVLIYRADTVLGDFEKKIKDEIYQKEHIIPFITYYYFFEKLVEMHNVDIKLLRNDTIKIFSSPLGGSSWKKDTFKLWKDFWIKINDELPDDYSDHKAYIIKKAASLPWILGSIKMLQELHELGALTVENLEKVLKDWDRVSDIPMETVKEIAHGTYDCFHDVESLGRTESRTVELLIKLIQIIKRNNIEKKQIPVDDILNCVYQEITGKNAYSQEQINIIMGTVMDIGKIILDEKTGKNELSNALQMLVSILVIMNT